MDIPFYDRLVYRPEYQYAFSYYQERIDQILSAYTNSAYVVDPNNVIELYDALQCISDLDNDSCITEAQKLEYKAHVPAIQRVVGVYFSKISDDTFAEIAAAVHPQFAYRFWGLMCRYKIATKISPITMKAFLLANPHHLDDVLAQKEMAQQFSDTLYACFIDIPSRITILISAELAKQDRKTKTLHVKVAFSPSQMNTLLKKYIEEETANINQLRLIHISQNDPLIGLDDEVRLLAKRKEEKLSEELFERSVAVEHGVVVSFGPYDDWKHFEKKNNEYWEMYDSRWIEENLDYPTLLDNLIHWLDYVDPQCRSNLPMRKHQISALEDIAIVKGKNTYDVGHEFKLTHFLQLIKMQGYCGQLNKHGIHLEEIIKWFFEEYLSSEFHVNNFTYTAPTQEASYLEKCRLIAGEIESILKQFKLYQMHGYIDIDLLELSSEHLFFSQLPSLLDSKYAYAKSDKVKWSICHLFDDCMLGLSPDGDFVHDSLFESMLHNKSLPQSAFSGNYQGKSLEYLLELGVLIVSDGTLSLDPVKTKILRDLHEYGVVCCHHISTCKSVVEELISSGDLILKNTLFSLPEQEYLDYILNKATFSNGLDLRNKYVHGSNRRDENENYKDYLEFLLVLVTIVLKLNDEFCTKFPE